MDILLGLVAALFWPIVIVVGIVWLVKRKPSGPRVEHITSSQGFVPANQTTNESNLRSKIAAEIRAQLAQYKTQAQKKVVEDMAQTVEYFAAHSYYEQSVPTTTTEAKPQFVPADNFVVASESNTPSAGNIASQPYETPWRKLQLLDGATILLYLGAFFVLASIGLYVGLGQGTELKALLVSLITILFYVSGIALFNNTVRLKPAGLTFAAIGMATLPMAGAAIYYFAFNEQHGALVWLVTSFAAICLYAHAMYVLKSTLVSYMVVFSTLSVVLSSISSLGLAPYYYIQGIGFAGVLFAIASRLFNKESTALNGAYERSAMFMVPFSVGMAVLFAQKVGSAQLAFSMLLGAVYYAYVAISSVSARSLYTLLAQLMGVVSFIVGGYAVFGSARSVAALASLVAFVYTIVWLNWAQKRNRGDVYRLQVKSILLCLPYIALIALLANANTIWLAVLVVLLVSVIVYISDRDWVSGSSILLAVISLPLLICYFALADNPASSVVGLIYLVIGFVSLLIRYAMRSTATATDRVMLVLLLCFSQLLAAGLQFGAANNLQVTVSIAQLVLLTAWSFLEPSKKYWLFLPVFVQVTWLTAMFDDARYLFGGLASVVVYNLALASAKFTTTLHDWLALNSLFILPLVYGFGISSPNWGGVHYWYYYLALFITTLITRYSKQVINRYVSTTGYLTALSVVYVLGYVVDPWFGLGVSIVSFGILLYSEKLENGPWLGYIASLLPLGLLFHGDRSAKQALLALAITTALSLGCTLWRKRRYEAYLATFGMIVSLWFSGTVVYDWSSSYMMAIYLALTLAFIGVRYVLKPKSKSYSDVLMVGYSTSLGLAFIYACVTPWQTMSVGLFAVGLLLTAISYLEDSPLIIIGSFLAGYGSILRFADGNELSLNQTVGLLIFISQSVYWLLIYSKLATARAKYARGFQICVASLIPLVGLGYFDRPIFPASLTLFGAMLAKEVWNRGQTAREIALFMVHLSGLWWLYALGVREVQVFTQATAALFAGFAYWRRRLQATPATINQYLWTAVLMFSLPMVYQALASGNPAYSYLLLVEHVVLIVVSIAFKRATFAWWGIAVTVAAVLYQLRKLRYAALAFLGAFIISLAVYFLLKYNRPDADKK